MTSAKEIQKRYIQQMIEEEKKELAENAHLIHSFKANCAEKGITLTENNFGYVDKIGIVACYPNIVASLCPDFSKDKEGLVDFKLLNTLFEKKRFASGFLYAPNFMLMAHPCFRRGLHPDANFAPRFIDLFWNLNESEITTFISLDYDRVRINVDNIMCLEEDTWYGAKFNRQVSNIHDNISKLRPPLDIDDFLLSFCFDDAYSLDIKWETKNEIKSFQAEEFKTEKNKIIRDGINLYPAKYIHAEYDLKGNYFRHFDGAIHFYTEEEYFIRRDADFNYNDKNSFQIKSNSIKLFKMNANISTDTWIEYTSHFFTGNPLAIEYFEGKYPDSISEILEAVKKKKQT